MLAIVASTALATSAGAGMKSTHQLDGTCATTGGGKIVPIPGWAGESIDRRLLTDIRWLKRRYPIFITDGYSDDPVHAANGEHPLGLALDIVPDKTKGGTWQDVTRLARWADPRAGRPRAPFRWVGYDGDAGHGRHHHLHLSWSHSAAKAKRTARTVYTLRCPAPLAPIPPEPTPPPPEPPAPEPPATTGGVGGKPPSTGGVGGRLAPLVAEKAGVDFPG